MAGNTIKGLTVEIGGDTTKLGKALEGVNKKSRDLSSELGQINKLLKMDPGNADLLAQKQKVLAEAVKNTTEKLETLREAEQQVQRQFEKGEVSEEQVRALQREIVATTKKLDQYKSAAEKTEKALKGTGDESEELEDSTQKVKKGADKAEKALDEYADSAEKAEKSSGKLSKVGGAVGKGLAAVGAVVAAAGAALIASAEASREYRREMGKLETAFDTAGHSSEAATETYKALQGVLGETDQAVEAANHLAKLTDNEKDLQKWTDICTGVYATFGASLPIEGLTEAANETAKVGKVTGPLADALNWAGVNEDKFNESLAACSNEQERQTLIMETLNGLYDDAAKKYKETNAEVIRANQANEEWASTVAEVGGAVEPLLTDVKFLGASLVKDLVPGIKEVTGAFRGMLNGDDEAAANLGEALSGIATNVLTKITDALPAVAQMGVSLITTLISSIVQALPQLLDTGVQVAVSLIDGIVSAIPQIIAAVTTIIPHLAQSLTSGVSQIVTALVNGLVTAIPQLIQGAVQFLGAIIQAIPVICQQLAPQIAPIISTICDALITNIPLLLDGALQLLDAIVQAIPVICEALLPEVPRIVQTLAAKLVEMVPMLLEGAVTLLFALIDAIPVLLDALLPEIPKIIDSVIDSLLTMTPVLLEGAITLFMALVEAIPKIVVMLLQRLPDILKTINSVLSSLPRLLWGILLQAIAKLGEFVVKSVAKAYEMGTKVKAEFVKFLTKLPGVFWDYLVKVVGKVIQFGKDLVTEAKSAGKDLVTGLWNGINGKAKWLKEKIKGWVGNVTDFLKKLFGINSPSKVTAWMGEMLDEGLAKGVEDNATAPTKAMSRLSDDMLTEAEDMNGLTLERRLQHTFSAPAAATVAETGMLDKLDKILRAIERGQIITINGDTLVGATVDSMNSALGQRRVLAERGAV
jgi:phage-related protein